jgi:hypothetical protein
VDHRGRVGAALGGTPHGSSDEPFRREERKLGVSRDRPEAAVARRQIPDAAAAEAAVYLGQPLELDGSAKSIPGGAAKQTSAIAASLRGPHICARGHGLREDCEGFIHTLCTLRKIDGSLGACARKATTTLDSTTGWDCRELGPARIARALSLEYHRHAQRVTVFKRRRPPRPRRYPISFSPNSEKRESKKANDLSTSRRPDMTDDLPCAGRRSTRSPRAHIVTRGPGAPPAGCELWQEHARRSFDAARRSSPHPLDPMRLLQARRVQPTGEFIRRAGLARALRDPRRA